MPLMGVAFQPIHLVAVDVDGRTQLWAAATSRSRAVPAVRRHVSTEAKLRLLSRFLTSQQRANLHLPPDGVRRLPDDLL